MCYKYLFVLILLCSINLPANDKSIELIDSTSQKCSILITKRLQDFEDPYKKAVTKIDTCKKNDIIAVTSFLEQDVTQVYFNDIIHSYCIYEFEIVLLLRTQTSNLSCVHRGQKRKERVSS